MQSMTIILPRSPYGPTDPKPGFFYYDEAKANRAVQFIERLVVHTKGRHAGAPFILDEWQKNEIVKPLFGTMMRDDQYDEYVRQARIAWLEMARKLRTARASFFQRLPFSA
jgi:phage terminase large subunit-like protein